MIILRNMFGCSGDGFERVCSVLGRVDKDAQDTEHKLKVLQEETEKNNVLAKHMVTNAVTL